MPNFVGVVKGSEEYKNTIKERNAIKAEALALIKKTITDVTEDQDVLDALECIAPTRKSAGSRTSTKGPSKLDIISVKFTEVGTEIDEDTIFSEFKLGRAEMRGITRDLIKKAPTPAERKFISFDPIKGIYTLESIGAEVPENWVGYVPVEVIMEESDVEDMEEDL